jgi:glutamate synthase (NADPH/NADH) small chain
MDCGIPFCHKGCPLGNIIPRLERPRVPRPLARGDRALHSTNNFPEFTGRICPASCEEACVLNINDDPVTIKNIEKHIIDTPSTGWVAPQPRRRKTGKTVAVVGSGPPAGAARSSSRAPGMPSRSSSATDRIGGLLALRHPDFKMEKMAHRSAAWRADGGPRASRFLHGIDVGKDVQGEQLRASSTPSCSRAARRSRATCRPGREPGGIHSRWSSCAAGTR